MVARSSRAGSPVGFLSGASPSHNSSISPLFPENVTVCQPMCCLCQEYALHQMTSCVAGIVSLISAGHTLQVYFLMSGYG